MNGIFKNWIMLLCIGVFLLTWFFLTVDFIGNSLIRNIIGIIIISVTLILIIWLIAFTIRVFWKLIKR
jgi:hypothetical protein